MIYKQLPKENLQDQINNTLDRLLYLENDDETILWLNSAPTKKVLWGIASSGTSVLLAILKQPKLAVQYKVAASEALLECAYMRRIQKQFSSQNGEELLLTTLNHRESDFVTKQYVAKCLYAFTSFSLTIIESAVHNNGVNILLKALQNNDSSEANRRYKEHALSCLALLTVNNEAKQELAINPQGIPTLLKILESGSENDKDKAMLCLWNILVSPCPLSYNQTERQRLVNENLVNKEEQIVNAIYQLKFSAKKDIRTLANKTLKALWPLSTKIRTAIQNQRNIPMAKESALTVEMRAITSSIPRRLQTAVAIIGAPVPIASQGPINRRRILPQSLIPQNDQ